MTRIDVRKMAHQIRENKDKIKHLTEDDKAKFLESCLKRAPNLTPTANAYLINAVPIVNVTIVS